MRRLRTAATSRGVVWLFAALAGCNYDNPGFKVKGNADASSASSETSVGMTGATSETGVTGTPTTGEPPDTTTGVPETSTTTMGVSETSSGEAGSSTGPQGPPVFPPDCGEDGKQIIMYAVAADTYFIYNASDPGQCDELMEYCKNTNTGRASYRNVFNRNDYVSVFAVRFETAAIEYMGYPVPPDVVKLKLKLFIERQDPQHADDVQLFPKRFDPADASWPEGDNYGLEPCMLGDSSYACRSCKADSSCADAWVHPIAEIIAGKTNMVGEAIVVSKDYAETTDVVLDAKLELPLFAKGHPGFLIAASDPVYEATLVVKAQEAGPNYAPQLIAEFCKPVD